MRTIIYPAKDIGRAKALFSRLFGVEPYADEPYYLGYRVGDQEVGLDPNGHSEVMTAYWHAGDIKSLQLLVDAGAQPVQEIKDVGGGRLIASARDVDGNIIGLLRDRP
jgi:predicted enzyme related to lactoylglutathione lyase